jgi:ubiquinol-cytochrome c reductase iron-sulfur subunit
MSDTASAAAAHADDGETRRDFLLISTITVGAVGVGLAAWPFVDSMNPSKDVLALSSIELDIAPIEEGQAITVIWRGKPVFIRNRTKPEIDRAVKEDADEFRDPAKDSERVQKGKEKWLVMVGICTHLGCIPLGQREGEPKGEWNGWFCPCHGSHYDTSGRIRKGPAPRNLDVPPYTFLSDTTVRIG